MKKKEEKKNPAPSYEKPKLRTIELAAEEVLGAGCKNTIEPGPAAEFCVMTMCLAEAS